MIRFDFKEKPKKLKALDTRRTLPFILVFFSNDETDTIYWWQSGALS